MREKLDLVLRVSEGISISLPADSRVFRAQTGRLEGKTITSGSSRHLGGILEEEEEGELRLVTELEGVTEIGVTIDKGIFRVTWGSTDSGGVDISINWTYILIMTLYLEGSNNL